MGFQVSCAANTDVWKKPPTHDVFTGKLSSRPILIGQLTQTAPYHVHSKKALNSFRSTTLTFHAKYTLQFDQAGILFIITHPTKPRKWIKAGIEFFDGKPRLSTVCCDRWADWSVASLEDASRAADIENGKETVTILIEKEIGETGHCLWAYHVDGDKKVPMREIAWVFGEDFGEGWDLEVAAAVARPAKTADGEFVADFDNFDVTWQ